MYYTTAYSDLVDLTVSRYLPRWASYRDEHWDNDYRWSPESPLVQTKIYTKRRPEQLKTDVMIEWQDLKVFMVKGATMI